MSDQALLLQTVCALFLRCFSVSCCLSAIDALIVGIETQAVYLGNKKTWTRKIVLVTDGEGPMEIEDWETTVHKMNQLAISLTVV
jgi:hypothetical protein